MACLVEWARGRAGAAPLRRSPALDSSAALKADAIVRCGVFSHTPCRRSFVSFFLEAGYARARRWSAAEVLALGSDELGTAREAFRLWLESPVHREDLLGRNWRDLGVAVSLGRDESGGREAVWVVDVGWRR